MKNETEFKYIITHPGNVHMDDFISVCIAQYALTDKRLPVYRMEPTQRELEDPTVLVLDVGGLYEREKGNFDHHQFPQSEVCCTLSLLNDYYEWGLECLPWFDFFVSMDHCGPMKTREKFSCDLTPPQFSDPVLGTLKDFFEELDNDDFSAFKLLTYIGQNVFEKAAEFSTEVKKAIGCLTYFADIKLLYFNESFADDIKNHVIREYARYCEFAISPDPRGPGQVIFRVKGILDLNILTETEIKTSFIHRAGFIAKTPRVYLTEDYHAAFKLLGNA